MERQPKVLPELEIDDKAVADNIKETSANSLAPALTLAIGLTYCIQTPATLKYGSC